MTSSALLLLPLLACAVRAVPPPAWMFPVPSTELQPPPPPDASADAIPAPSWADVVPAILSAPAAGPTPQGDDIAAPSWADVLPPPEPSDELQPPPAPAPASGVFPADPEATVVDILKVEPKQPATTEAVLVLEQEDQDAVYIKPTVNEVKYRPQNPSTLDSKQALLKTTSTKFPKKYRPEFHKAEGGAKKNLNPKPAVPEQEAAESAGFAAVSLGAGGEHFGGGHLGGGGGSGERVEFQMHGQHGPSSYKFGFDTGNVHNRQFRYEERDAHGHVKGHYGFYDKSGKLQIVKYSADPHTGYHAEPGVVGH